jgi:hypothetical protein
MQVRVHQARHQRQPGQVYHAGAGGNRRGRAVHGSDRAVGDHDRRLGYERRADAIEQGRRAKD